MGDDDPTVSVISEERGRVDDMSDEKEQFSSKPENYVTGARSREYRNLEQKSHRERAGRYSYGLCSAHFKVAAICTRLLTLASELVHAYGTPSDSHIPHGSNGCSAYRQRSDIGHGSVVTAGFAC
jgi:hypothetical protein